MVVDIECEGQSVSEGLVKWRGWGGDFYGENGTLAGSIVSVMAAQDIPIRNKEKKINKKVK